MFCVAPVAGQAEDFDVGDRDVIDPAIDLDFTLGSDEVYSDEMLQDQEGDPGPKVYTTENMNEALEADESVIIKDAQRF